MEEKVCKKNFCAKLRFAYDRKGEGTVAKTWKKVLLCAGALLLAAGLWIWMERPFGVSLGDMEADARQSQRVPEGWACAAGSGEETAGLLFYPPDGGADGFIFSVYAQNDGLSFGWFFRGGGALGTIADTAAVYEEDGERVYLSMNTAGICRAITGAGETIPLEPGRPFVLVRGEAVAFYDENGAPVPCYAM